MLQGADFIKDHFDYLAWQTNHFYRIFIPVCMIFLTQFNLYLFLIVPFVLAISVVITNYTDNIFGQLL